MIRLPLFYYLSVSKILLPQNGFKSSSTVEIGLISKFITNVSSTLGVKNAGRDGPIRILLLFVHIDSKTFHIVNLTAQT